MPLNPTSSSPNLQTHHEQLPTLLPKLHLHPTLLSSPNSFKLQTSKLCKQHQRTMRPTSPSCRFLPGGRGLITQVSSKFLLRSAHMLNLPIQKHRPFQNSPMHKNKSSVSSHYFPSPHPPPPSHTPTCSPSFPFPPLAPWKTSS